MSGKHVRIWVEDDDGQLRDLAEGGIDFELTLADAAGTPAFISGLPAVEIEITGRFGGWFRPVYRWLGDRLARVFAFSKN